VLPLFVVGVPEELLESAQRPLQAVRAGGVEMAAAQASRTVQEIWAHSKVAEDDREMLKDESWREGARATCPGCGAPLPGKVKFCGECGVKIEGDRHCTECGATLKAGTKFCAECGTKQG